MASTSQNSKSVIQDHERKNSISLWAQPIQEEMVTDVTLNEQSAPKNENDNVVFLEQMMSDDLLIPKAVPTPSKHGSQLNVNSITNQRRPSINNRRGSNSVRLRRSSKDLSNFINQENASFEDMVPLPQIPRFTTAMSLEAQYAIMMGYEDRIRRRLAVTFPDHSNLLQRTLSPKSAGRPLQLYSSLFKSDLHDVDIQSKSKNNTMTLQQRRNELHAAENQTLDISLEQKLMLSRRLKLAHCILDAMDINSGLPSLTPSQFLLSHTDGFNPVQRYNWWSGSWGNDFGVKQQRQTQSQHYHKLLPPQELQIPLFIVE